MLKSFFTNSAIYTFSSLLSKGLNLLLLPLYTRLLNPSDFGLFDFLTLLGALIGLSLPLEISQGVARYYHEADTEAEKRRYAATSLWFTVGVYGALAAVCLPLAVPMSQWLLGDAGWSGVFRLAVLCTGLNGLFYLFQNQLKWELRAKDHALLSQFYALASLGLTLLWVAGFKTGLTGLFYGQLTALLLICPLGVWLLRRSYWGAFSWSHLRDMLNYSLPLVPAGLAIFFALYIDRLAIRDLLSYHEVGLYGVGMRFATVVSLLISGFQSSLSPLVFQHHREPETPLQLELLFRLFVCGSLLCVSGMALFATEMLALFTTKAYAAAAPIIPLMTLATLLTNAYLFAPGLSLAKRTREMALINFLFAILNTLLNYCLIPWLGFTGAALATCLSSGVMAWLYFREGLPHYPIPYRWPKLAAASGLNLLLVLSLFVLNMLAWPMGLLTLLKAGIWLGLAVGTVLLLTSPQERDLDRLKTRGIMG